MLINPGNLVYPLFVKDGRGIKESVASMPGVYRFSPDSLVQEAAELKELGINKILLFGIPQKKDIEGSSAYNSENIVSMAVSLLKQHFPELTIMTDICLCAYTSHGHCGILNKGSDLLINNEATLPLLSKMALSHAKAGADYVAPSAMIKNQVARIRDMLDENDCKKTKIMGYSAKFASSFYGPFRDIVYSTPQFGDRSNYQLDYSSIDGPFKKIKSDIEEGADIVMVKPALCYLDVIKEAKKLFNHALAVFNVSGEYSMVKTGAAAGYWDEKEIVTEIITSIKRSGADIIITYHARDIAAWLKEKGNN